MTQKTAIIIGAGPAGLTAAYELATRTDIRPVIFEADIQVGGISKTVNYKDNRIDIGGHRFFSKSDRVMDWWTHILPLQARSSDEDGLIITYHNRQRDLSEPIGGPDPEQVDAVMLVRDRTSRILFGRKLYDYPLKFNRRTFANLGLARTLRIVASYAKARLRPIRPERTLRDFIVNRFGEELYATFFRDYTEKVWGVSCEEIPADWGAQRIKGVSISGLIRNMLRKLKPGKASLSQKDTETSLIERFLYPKFGPGQLWEEVAKKIERHGGTLHLETRVTNVSHDKGRITGVTVQGPDGSTQEITADYLFSSMPVQHLIGGQRPPAPPALLEISEGLSYRDFLTVGLLLKRIDLGGGADGHTLAERVPDNWIYVQESDVKVGRLQLFNNWSPYLVADPATVWVGLEYFVDEGDALWSMEDEALKRLGAEELQKIGVASVSNVLDGVVVRTHKAYPAYFGTYARFSEIEEYTMSFENLFCVGRNGMHRYNNQDHSMLTAMMAVDGIVEGRDVRRDLWQVNTEEEYHESKGG
ncbi:NAD(P)/FAD-dependent oxidoreductase [Alisedimentitalea sp. MJ-SS2]|uniref:NAD(P)/FAD-dependent oxidoreductase n=1 Tax=Aliisedimentitalea sp. MJ-SS2 TaxID=3049795 RepID=UPI00290B5552|nr:NAD(P)/FAD-dependent oxidoreductase [Alisedimentitalea sp. MJ-SS2]MDU8928284.1 NAD(P)/FAD-dependent oxidoreductase [Alisedimentitalea sp. MJ-SS2]